MLCDYVKDAFKRPRGLHHEIHLAQIPASQKKVSFQRNTDVSPLICGAACVFQCIRWRPAEAESCCPWLFRACFLTDMLVILYGFSIGFVWQQDIMSKNVFKNMLQSF